MKSFPKILVCVLLSAASTWSFAQVLDHRLWLPSSSSHLRDQLVQAAYLALQNPECREVLYGRLNEFRTENNDTSYTILCMRDARTTFNLVFFARDLSPVTTEQMRERRDTNATREDLERLRNLLQGGSGATDNAAPTQSGTQSDTPVQNGQTPEVF